LFSTTSVPSDSCTPIKSNSYSDSSFTNGMSESTLYGILTFHIPNLMSTFLSLGHLIKESVKVEALCYISYQAYALQGGVISPVLNPKLEDHPFLVIHDCLFNIHGYLTYLQAICSIQNLRKHHAVVTSTEKCLKNYSSYSSMLYHVCRKE
jgi:hypothetical protein